MADCTITCSLAGILMEEDLGSQDYNKVLYHEVGHALGLRHPYEPGYGEIGEAVPSGTYCALMWPHYNNARASSSFEFYDIAELSKTYPK